MFTVFKYVHLGTENTFVHFRQSLKITLNPLKITFKLYFWIYDLKESRWASVSLDKKVNIGLGLSDLKFQPSNFNGAASASVLRLPDQKTKSPKNQKTKKPKNQKTKKPKVQKTKRPKDQKTKKPKDQKTMGSWVSINMYACQLEQPWRNFSKISIRLGFGVFDSQSLKKLSWVYVHGCLSICMHAN